MTVPPPGPLIDEAAQFAEALLGKIRGADLPPELVARFTAAVADVAVAGAGLLRVVAEVASTWGEAAERADPETSGASGADVDGPRVERIDIG
jgi:hypothetical protein